MKRNIPVAVEVVTNMIEVEFPEYPVYYASNFDKVDCELIAILPKYQNHECIYNIFQVTRGRQDYMDFFPEKDCASKYFLNKDESTYLQRVAMVIFRGMPTLYTEISEELFFEKRIELLANFLNDKFWDSRLNPHIPNQRMDTLSAGGTPFHDFVPPPVPPDNVSQQSGGGSGITTLSEGTQTISVSTENSGVGRTTIVISPDDKRHSMSMGTAFQIAPWRTHSYQNTRLFNIKNPR